VTSVRVVPAFDEGEQRLSGLFMRMELRAREQFTFKRGEEGLAHGVGVRRQLRP
jgi:hypothetical protein